MDLFTPIVDEDRQHDIFKLLINPALHAERKVITDWATGFIDRDNKFVKEFQTTFESSFLELICAELAGDFHLGYARQLTDKSSLLFDLAF